MNKTLTVLLALTLLALAPLAHAAEGKIGVVNVQYVLAKSKVGQEAQSDIKDFGKAKQAELEQQRAKLQKESEALQKNASIQSEAARKQAQKTFQAHMMNFREAAQKARAAVAKQEQELLQPIQASLANVIRNYAIRYGYSVILDKRAVVYSADERDLSDEILKAFNAAQKGK